MRLPPITLPRDLAAMLFLGALSSCGSGNAADSFETPGAALFAQETCADCHGADGAGGTLGPALETLSAHWTVSDLSAYLADPRQFLHSDERLVRLGQRYIMPMPDFRGLDEATRLVLAEHLLATFP